MENKTAEFITFFLAMAGYIGMSVVLILSRKKNIPFTLWRIVSGIILAHVFMVWNFHYEWKLSMAVRNGHSGFLIFHSALLMIIISTISTKSFAIILIRVSSLVVTAGAVGAVFRYDVVTIYKVPVIICASIITFSMLKIIIYKRKKLINKIQ